MADTQEVGGGTPHFEVRHRMARALEVAGLSREDIATELDVHRNTISNYLNGKTAPTRAVLIAWHMRTGVPLRWLETGESSPIVLPTGGYQAVEMDLEAA